jgi:hypothetical protein
VLPHQWLNLCFSIDGQTSLNETAPWGRPRGYETRRFLYLSTLVLKRGAIGAVLLLTSLGTKLTTCNTFFVHVSSMYVAAQISVVHISQYALHRTVLA